MAKIIKFKGEVEYTESPQYNPLRWVLMHKDDENTYTEIAKVMRCRDYLNDLVARYAGRTEDMRVYGFDAGPLTLNEEGLYVQLREIVDMEAFEHNLNIVSEKIASQGFEGMTFEPYSPKRGILFIPRKVFDSTYTVSVLTYLIRISNVDQKAESYESFIGDWIGRVSDNPWSGYARAILTACMVYPQEEYRGKTMFVRGPAEYNKIMTASIGWIHNNGALNWAMNTNMPR